MNIRRALVILAIITATAVYAQENGLDSVPQTAEGVSFFQTIIQGGVMMVPLALLALLCSTLIVERGIYYIRHKSWDKQVLFAFIEDAASQSSAKFREEREDDLREAVRIYLNKLEKGLPLLNGVGNLGPLVGFFGTVIGMIKAFAAIAAATTVNAKVVAVGIQVALVTTAGGLAVAVPALAAYYLFIHIIQKIGAQADEAILRQVEKLPRLGND